MDGSGVANSVFRYRPPALADGLELAQEWGGIISDVPPGSLATLSNLRIGDVILTLDER